MERASEEENKKRKVNRIVSYILVGVSVIVLAFCVSQIVSYVTLVNENAALSKDLEALKQDSNYLRQNFPILRDEEYYSVYIDGDYQYVDSSNDSIARIR